MRPSKKQGKSRVCGTFKKTRKSTNIQSKKYKYTVKKVQTYSFGAKTDSMKKYKYTVLEQNRQFEKVQIYSFGKDNCQNLTAMP